MMMNVKRVLALVVILAAMPVACECMPRHGAVSGSLSTGGVGGQTWAQETLANGLRVVYAPVSNTPAVHVRVVYHVGYVGEPHVHCYLPVAPEA